MNGRCRHPLLRHRQFGSLALAALTASLPAQAAEARAEAAFRTLLGELDAAFARGEVDGYLGRFEPDQPEAHRQLRKLLTAQCAAGVPLRRSSSLRTPPRLLGGRWVARVQHELTLAEDPTRPAVTHDTMLAVRLTGHTAVPTFAIEVPTLAACLADGRFRCPPCNFEIGGQPDWLAVPTRSDGAMAVEAVTFHRLGTDLRVDVAVQIDDGSAPPAAIPIAERLAAAWVAIWPGARSGVATAWPEAQALTPAPAMAPAPATPTCGLSTARIRIDLPAPSADDAEQVLCHVVAQGPLQHLLVVHGRTTTLQQQAAAVAALLGSYRRLEPNLDVALAAARPLLHHTGGSFDGATYHNRLWQVSLTGPRGWRTEQRPGGAAFRVAWASPTGGRLWCFGHKVPPGLPQWCTESAELWVAELLADRGLCSEPPSGSAWQPVDGSEALARNWTCKQRDAVPGTSWPQRTVRVVVRPDLLLVVDAYATDAVEQQALQQALATLR